MEIPQGSCTAGYLLYSANTRTSLHLIAFFGDKDVNLQ